ncbi:hypothetical protein CMI37_14790 [Candidatus Pacearchaeota archaeon]|nr:hypothetical protein [Candidatus Pacearchaeota archaeon]|tara:strand:+ start:1258 stop:1563 length:306 start_codon:yes stop_codon:yes gene_type:complete
MAKTTKIAVRKAKTAAKKVTSVIKKKPKVGVLSIRSKNIGDLRDKCVNYADLEHAAYLESGDAEAGKAAQNGIKGALNAIKAQLAYQKITGRVKRIPFCEE